MRRNRNAKIVATLGPSSSSKEAVGELFAAGADVFRLNFSHGTHDDHKAVYDAVRTVESEVGLPIGVMIDLQGPKLRIGRFEDGSVDLAPEDRFELRLETHTGDQSGVQLPHPEIFSVARQGTLLQLDDGRITLRVEQASDAVLTTKVVTGGQLSDRKGVNVPGVSLPISALTDKDRDDLEFGLGLGADWVALSFVQKPEDLTEARTLIDGRARLLAKLEKPSALENLTAIVEKADAVMVARGDLGVELPPEQVPAIQKRILSECRDQAKPVIVATQMLESMVDSPVPTRAEVSDVAGAIYDGADAVMLSAESASGSHPLEAVSVMSRIICSTESDPVYRRMLDSSRPTNEPSDSDSIAAAACHIAEARNCRAVATFTTTGSTTMRAARYRGQVPVLGLTDSKSVSRALTLVWGVRSFETLDARSFPDMVEKSTVIAHSADIASPGDNIVVTAGVPFGTPGATNILRIVTVAAS